MFRATCAVFFSLTLALRLTLSGKSTSVLRGVLTLQKLLERSQTGDRPVIVPGGGINPESIGAVLDYLLPFGLKEIHMSGGRWAESQMAHRPEGMGMGPSVENEWDIWTTDGNNVREVAGTVEEYLRKRC